MLDRKVVYDINFDGLSCGRRGKASKHKLQLGGSGIDPDHAIFLKDGNHVKLMPLSEKAMANCKVNGVPIASMKGVRLKPNDRICLGSSSYFLFKNKQHEKEASMPDSETDPITVEMAADEV
jgi:hypothetical protein